MYLQYGASSGYYILVAKNGLVPAAYICYRPTPLTEGTWDIYLIAVAPDRRRKRMDRSLLMNAEAEIIETKGRFIFIEFSSKAE